MSDYKIASLKLISGEELICTLLNLEQGEEYTTVSFKDPVRISLRDRRKTKKYSLEPWLCIKNNIVHTIDITKILTVYEVTDINILNDYSEFFDRKAKLSAKPKRKFNSSTKIGYIGNTNDFKNSLEKLYKDTDSYEKPKDI